MIPTIIHRLIANLRNNAFLPWRERKREIVEKRDARRCGGWMKNITKRENYMRKNNKKKRKKSFKKPNKKPYFSHIDRSANNCQTEYL
jgi:hypothetical protein